MHNRWAMSSGTLHYTTAESAKDWWPLAPDDQGSPHLACKLASKRLALRIAPCALRSSHQHARSGLDQNLGAWLSNPRVEDIPEQCRWEAA